MASNDIGDSSFALMHNIVILRKLMQVAESIHNSPLELSLNSDFSGFIRRDGVRRSEFESIPDAVGKMKRAIESSVAEKINTANEMMTKSIEVARTWEKYRNEWVIIGQDMLDGKWNVVSNIEKPPPGPTCIQESKESFDNVYRTTKTVEEFRAIPASDAVLTDGDKAAIHDAYKALTFPKSIRKKLKGI